MRLEEIMSSLKGRPSWIKSFGLVALGALLFAVLHPIVGAASTLSLKKGESPVSLPTGSPALALQNAFIDVAASVSPAVVNISSEWTENVRGMNDFGDMNDFFNFWFNGPHGGQRQAPQLKQKQRSLGSGFLISEDGYILTNAHVLGKAQKVTVTFENGTTYTAKIVGKAEGVDIGVVKITDPNKKFPFVSLGDSDAIKVGEWAIAIGNPFALDHTVTTGIISAKGRSVAISQEAGYQNYIQTDASINPGNSGGPLCNIEGEVIGINSAIYSQSGGSVGIGFAIPCNIARKAAEDLVNEGKVIRAGLGAMVQDLNTQMAKSFGLNSTEGALLSNINAGSAAEKAGLKAGDIVLSINGIKVNSSGDLIAKLYTYKPGETVQLLVLRSGAQSTVPVTLQTLAEKTAKSQDSSDDDNAADDDSQGRDQGLGFAFQDPTPELKERLSANAPKGPVVVEVQRGTPAAGAGLQPGDIILKAGNAAIYSAKQLTVILKKENLKNGIRLFVWRDGVTLYTFLQSGDE